MSRAGIQTRQLPREGDAGRRPAAAPAAQTGRPRPGPAPASDPADELTRGIVQAATRDELHLVIANRVRGLVGARQVFVFRTGAAATLAAISDIPAVNRRAPFTQDIERIVSILLKSGDLDRSRIFRIDGSAADLAPELDSYPFKDLSWTPFAGPMGPAGGMLCARNGIWNSAHVEFLEAVAAACARRIAELDAGSARRLPAWARLPAGRGRIAAIATAAGIAALCFPVAMTVSAPFTVASRDHAVVSAPMDGVLGEILVEPGAALKAGQPVARFVDLVQQNQVAIARREVELGEAMLRRASQMSFDEEDGRRQLGPTIAELEVKRARLKLAQEQSERATVLAPGDGIAIFTDAKSLVGRPFAIGERILDIADPSRLQFEISLGVADSIALEEGAQVRLFPDSSPLRSLPATLSQISYQAEPDAAGRLSYRLVATTGGEGRVPLKLGTGGVAKVYGRTVPLVFYLFRRPVTAVRQWLGI